MKKIFQDACDKYVTAVVVYADKTHHTLHEDAELTKAVSADVVLNAFLKGVLVVETEDTHIRPVKISSDGGNVDIEGVTYTAAGSVAPSDTVYS